MENTEKLKKYYGIYVKVVKKDKNFMTLNYKTIGRYDTIKEAAFLCMDIATAMRLCDDDNITTTTKIIAYYTNNFYEIKKIDWNDFWEPPVGELEMKFFYESLKKLS